MRVTRPSRRAFLSGLLATPLVAACAGFDTSGAASPGTVGFLSTQFAPVEERQRYEQVLRRLPVPVAYNPVDAGVFRTTIDSQTRSGQVQVGMVGGLHGDLAPIADRLDDVDGLLADLSGAGYAPEVLQLARIGGAAAKYVPWMQATYVLAVNKRALEWLPPGVDVQNLDYAGFLRWMQAGKAAHGAPIFGLPAGPKGLHHRFHQGFLLPSFTGGQITTFASADAVTAWEYLRDLWAVTAPASTNYAFMQEPLARGEVLVGWDHVARLVGATKERPDDWLMVPAPRGPKGLGYMLIVAGVALPHGGPERDKAEQAIRGMASAPMQVETLRSNAFFPVTSIELPTDLPGGIALEAKAVRAQRDADGAVLALPPVGVGAKDGEVSQVFKDCFTQICLDARPARQVVDAQAGVLSRILDGLKVPCWAPDPPGAVCEVG
ncbi:extracellular solute-binding protein [Pseudonocardia sp. CA-107938]|uniref:extracellular solute-binding protein n=1 Tax=Pseudonocardia sp. CA-107938 TaxID=3240021 RepID=UPI003D8BE6F4